MKNTSLINRILLLVLTYVIAGKIGQMLAIPPGAVTAFWPPSGFALAFILLINKRVWPGIWLGSFILNLTGFFSWDFFLPSIAAPVLIACGATLEALVAAALFKKLSAGTNPIRNTYSAFTFIISAAIACIISATIGTLTMLFLGFIYPSDFWITWFTWWLGDSAGILTITPTLRLIATSTKEDFTPKKLIEVAALFSILFGISLWLIPSYNQLTFVLIPIVIWAVFRLGPLWSFITSLLISIIAIVFILEGYQIFGGTNTHQSSFLLQAFITVVCIVNLLMTTLIDVNRKTYLALRQSNSALENKVHQRTHALSQTLENLKQKEAQLLQSEKMSSLGVITAGIAHEINNPMNFIYSSAQSLRRDVNDLTLLINKYLEFKPGSDSAQFMHEMDVLKTELQFDNLITEIPQLISTIQNGAARIATLVKNLRTFSRLDESEKKLANIEEGLDVTLDLLTSEQIRPISIKKDYGNIPLIDCYPGKLNQAFLNIILNAFAAVSQCKDPVVNISTRQIDDEHVVIEIADNGVGMTSGVKQHALDPFFTTKDVGKGVGLGLTIAYGIIKEHRGNLAIESEPGKGSKLIITLPI